MTLPRPLPRSRLLVLAMLAACAFDAAAQLPRTRSPNADAPPAPRGFPRQPEFPLAGLWRGARSLPPGTDTVTLLFTVDNGHLVGAMVYPRGLVVPHDKLTAQKNAMTWEQRNSGGGMWVYTVHLVGEDRMEGTVVLRDAPANLQPAPAGNVSLVRQLPTQR